MEINSVKWDYLYTHQIHEVNKMYPDYIFDLTLNI